MEKKKRRSHAKVSIWQKKNRRRFVFCVAPVVQEATRSCSWSDSETQSASGKIRLSTWGVNKTAAANWCKTLGNNDFVNKTAEKLRVIKLCFYFSI